MSRLVTLQVLGTTQGGNFEIKSDFYIYYFTDDGYSYCDEVGHTLAVRGA
jgi:hypothetical protein